MYWLTEAGDYYEGDRQSLNDQSVTQRPSMRHVWSNSLWSLGPEPVPLEVTRAQGKLALLNAGLLASAQAAATAAGQAAEIAFNDALTYERTSPTLNALATALGLSSSDLDNLFIAASKLKP